MHQANIFPPIPSRPLRSIGLLPSSPPRTAAGDVSKTRRYGVFLEAHHTVVLTSHGYAMGWVFCRAEAARRATMVRCMFRGSVPVMGCALFSRGDDPRHGRCTFRGSLHAVGCLPGSAWCVKVRCIVAPPRVCFVDRRPHSRNALLRQGFSKT